MSSCAQIGQLSGGERDKTPPQIIAEKSTPNFQTNFQKQTIELTFDEWVALNDAANQVVVSPPLAERPKVSLNGRTVQFSFGNAEILRPNATYTINFGESVQDLTERNSAKNLRFVFSTGNILDSLKFRARVVDADLGNPQEGILVMLYDQTADSVVRTSRPFYFAKTDKSGIATLENVRSGKFKIFALKDADANYRLSAPTEEMGFLDSLVEVAPNAVQPTIRLFSAEKKLQVTAKDDSRYGVLRLTFNRDLNPNEVSANGFENGKIIIQEQRKDSLVLWYDAPDNLATRFMLGLSADKTDTVRLRTRARANLPSLVSRRASDLQIAQNPVQPFEMIFSQPINRLDENKVQILDSAKKKVDFSYKIDGRRVIFENVKWREGEVFRLEMQPKSLTDIFYTQNDSAISQTFRITPRKDLGDLNLKIKGFDPKNQYVVQVQAGDGRVLNTAVVQQQANYAIRIDALTPDQFKLIVIEDQNRNGRWDTGDYDRHRQPESIFRYQLDPIRPNWELEADLEWDEIRNPKPEK